MQKNNSKKRVAEELISYTVINDKGSLTKLLKRYGVSVADKPSDKEVTTAVLVANKRSKAFQKDLAALLGKKLPEAGERFSNIVGNAQDFGFTGVDDVTYMKWTGVDDFNDFTGWDDWKDMGGQTYGQLSSIAQQTAAKQKATAPKGKTKAGSILASLWGFTKENVLTKDNINAGIQAGLNKVNTDTAAKQLAVDEKALALQQQQEEMRQAQTKASVGVSSNVWLYVGIGAVVVLVGVLAFRKK